MLNSSKMIGKSTWAFTDIRILSSSAVVGPMEGEGKLTQYFDHIYEDLYMGEDTWEKAERKMLEDSAKITIKKANKVESEIDIYLAGDLLNQNITASFSAEKMQIPFMGVYGACSTSMLSLSLASAIVDGGFANLALTGVSSHNCTAERQYRYPTEYGGQKPDIAQWTVTGAGTSIIGKEGNGPRVTYSTIGRVTERGIKNPLDMGSAMAPAAAQTIKTHFEDTGRSLEYYDLILTGDLASIGHPIAKELLYKEGIEFGENFNDCGLLIYSDDQKAFSGGSGCASSAVVTYGYILNEMSKGKLDKVLIVATGALLSTVSYQQGDVIPGIAHAVAIENI